MQPGAVPQGQPDRDLQRVAYDFPELNIIIHHLGVPWVEETISIASRFPNVYLAMSTWVNSIPIQPALVIERIGRILFECGPEKLIWGSEAPLAGAVQPLLDRCWDVQLQDGYGFPDISDDDRRLIYGENMMRLLGIGREALPAAPYRSRAPVVV